MAPPRRPRSRADFKVAIICALPEEANAVMKCFKHTWTGSDRQRIGRAPGDQNTYSYGQVGHHKVVLVHMAGMGPIEAASSASHLTMSFPQVKLGLVVGICGILPEREGTIMQLGDVVISTSIVHYNYGKQYDDGFERKDTLDETLGRPSKVIRGFLKFLQAEANRLDLVASIKEKLNNTAKADADAQRPPKEADLVFDRSYQHKHRNPNICQVCSMEGPGTRICDAARKASCKELGCQCPESRKFERANPEVHFGHMGSASLVMKSAIERDRVAGDEKVIAFEMEGAGAWDSLPTIVVKAGCDYADGHKNDIWRIYAAHVAAACTEAMLAQWTFEEMPDTHLHLKRVMNIPFEQDAAFVSQNDIIKTINAAFRQQARISLCGIGGIGKSQIAIEYAYLFHKAKSEHSVIWVYAANIQRVDEGFQDLAEMLELPDKDKEGANIYSIVSRYLRDERNGPWLMVLDNADDRGTFFDYRVMPDQSRNRIFDYIPQCKHGRVLITTRDQRLGRDLALQKEPVPVQRLTLKQARAMLQSRLDRQLRTSELRADDLLETLEYLPLAIAQAAAYVRHNDSDIDSYYGALRSSDRQMAKLLQKHYEDPRRYEEASNSNAVFRTWIVSFVQIQNELVRAAETLSLMAVLDRQGIGQDMLRKDEDDWDDLTEALGTLKAFSFITVKPNEKVYSMHRLVQVSTQTWLEHAGSIMQWQMNAVSLVSRLAPSGEFEDWVRWSQLLPHARTTIEYGCQTREQSLSKAHLLNHYAWYEMRHGWYGPASEKAKQALIIRQAFLAQDDDEVIFTQSLIALCLGYQSTISEAISIQRQALQARRSKLGSSHKQTLNSMNNLSWLLGKEARMKGTQAAWEPAVEMCKRVVEGRSGHPDLGPDHRQTITAMGNLAQTMAYGGHGMAAVDLAVDAYSKAKSNPALGSEHPDTISILGNYIEALLKVNMFTEAEAFARIELSAHQKLEGVNHPSTLRSMLRLEESLAGQGMPAKSVEALKLFGQACKGYGLTRSSSRVFQSAKEIRDQLTSEID